MCAPDRSSATMLTAAQGKQDTSTVIPVHTIERWTDLPAKLTNTARHLLAMDVMFVCCRLGAELD